LFEAMTLVQTKKTKAFPIVLLGTEYWAGLVQWIKEKLVSEKMIAESDVDLFYVTNDPADAAKLIEEFYKKTEMLTNF